ncbi:MAG: hypothetical protein COV01_02525 [Candidatus Taylorbacteria bacterium CG10_big_fil_rev_8_21_14_0_10_41_48]|uniref:Uncharacterized protein n=1 Tax=Candidatus Taylorbacteria bacterium CG10_big_fil_rev_8_21_14_0_10_41_48 TaxID=1975024 RepID=A0A2M8LCJ9_9BACT|nr:MAG: hypothetical protein COV01_02525 [Candidatus Taylorbacteria bacterium CG10_big_fil_rev_8_21_14_0_10_41_48]
MKTAISIILILLIIGIWFPIIPFPVKQGWHGVGGEWCGIVYDPVCDTRKVDFFTYKEIRDIVINQAY